MDVRARRFACSIQMPYLGSGSKPETSESSVIAYVTMIERWCQRLGSRNLSYPLRILSAQDTLRRQSASKQGEDGAGLNCQSRSA
jgi:hypothetical protein